MSDTWVDAQAAESPRSAPRPPNDGFILGSVWLELTFRCSLECVHCYTDSAPSRRDGALGRSDWEQVITDARRLGAGTVQFIGGEPTLHPDLTHLVRFASQSELQVEVFTNLVRVSSEIWDVFEECGVSLATSFYSRHHHVHDAITRRTGSQACTLRNMMAALARGHSLRVAVIDIIPEQDVPGTEAFLRRLGTLDVGVDRVRGVGRGSSLNRPAHPIDTLCGECTRTVAVDPDGWVYPCVFSRWLKLGNVGPEGLSSICLDENTSEVRRHLEKEFLARENQAATGPRVETDCSPDIRPRPDPCRPRPLPTCMPMRRCIPDCAPAGGCLPIPL